MKPINLNTVTGTITSATTLTAVDVSKSKGYGILLNLTVANPGALSGASYKLQYSLDGTTFIDSGVTNSVTATSKFIHEKVDPMFNFVQIVWAISAGSIAYSIQTLIKEENY
jgi:hypothetical protein